MNQRYLFDEATTLTKRKMREWGQIFAEVYLKRTKEVIKFSQSNNKVVVPKNEEKKVDGSKLKMRELLKIQMVKKVR